MFRVNRQTDYAIRVLLALAQRGSGARASTSEIQREMIIPRSFAQRVIADLAHGSFILTFPGRDGGVMLARPAREINLKQLLEYFENFRITSDCQKGGISCPFMQSCPICPHWKRLQSVMTQELEQVNFEYLANSQPHLHTLAQLGISS